MRRPIIATIVLLLAALPVVAQHGAGHAAGGGHFSGGHAGFSGGHAGGFSSRGFSGPRMSSSPRFSSGIRRGSVRGFSRVPPSRSNYSRGPVFRQRGPVFRTRNRGFSFHRNCIGLPCRRYYGYPWAYAYAGLYDPYWWWDQSSYDDDYERDRALANEMNQQSLDEQQMRREQDAEAASDQDVYASARPPAKPSASDAGTPIIPSTILVFRDRHQQEVQNYAIVGQTLWNFAPLRTEKIPLARLDLTATAKANDDRGVSFAVPADRAGQ